MSASQKLSPRQKRAAEAFVGPGKGNKKKALLLAGYPESVATTKQGREFTPDMMTYVRELLDREGITDSYLVKQHKKLFKATTPLTFEGEIVHWAPDNSTRLQATKLGYELKKLLKADVDTAGVIDRLVGVFIRVVVEFVPEAQKGKVLEQLETELPRAVGAHAGS